MLTSSLFVMAALAVAQSKVVVVQDQVRTTRVPEQALQLNVERRTLANGLVVLLAPDPTASSAAVSMTFRAGTLFEPRGRAGMAHLVEHVMLRGRTPDTDYVAMLERAGVLFLNAFTSAEFMSFEVEVPPAAVPLAVWVNTDRLATLPQKLDPADLDRHRSVVDVERILRTVDIPFGGVDMAIHRKLFPPPHPLRSAIIGRMPEIERVTTKEIRKFVARYLTPANGILTITGKFDPVAVNAQIDRTLARLPRGQRARPPREATIKGKTGIFRMREQRARQPRVTVLWRLEDLGRRSTDALTLGGWLLSNYVDGVFGTQVRAGMSPTEGAAYFRLDVVLPYDKTVKAATEEAEVFLRYLTSVDMPRDFLNATRLAIDRYSLFSMDTVRGQASLLTRLELAGEDATHPEAFNRRMWILERQTIRHVAWTNLLRGRRRLVVHARPTQPRVPRLNWNQRQ